MRARLPAASPPPLRGRVAVVSPHLDDALLSLGASLSAHVRAGGDVVVVTLFAGDPASPLAAGYWDRLGGFATAAEAAAGRRAEDVAVWGRLGVRVHPFDEADDQHPRTRTDDQLRAGLRSALEGCDEVLLPGFPLGHADHRATTALALSALAADRPVRLYVEEPYGLRARTPVEPPWSGVGWGRLPYGAADVTAKLRALRRYASQLPLLGPDRFGRPSRVGALVAQAQVAAAAVRPGERVTAPVAAGALPAPVPAPRAG